MNKTEYGMCPPLSDKNFRLVLISSKKGVDEKLVKIAKKYYPELFDQ